MHMRTRYCSPWGQEMGISNVLKRLWLGGTVLGRICGASVQDLFGSLPMECPRDGPGCSLGCSAPLYYDVGTGRGTQWPSNPKAALSFVGVLAVCALVASAVASPAPRATAAALYSPSTTTLRPAAQSALLSRPGHHVPAGHGTPSLRSGAQPSATVMEAKVGGRGTEPGAMLPLFHNEGLGYGAVGIAIMSVVSAVAYVLGRQSAKGPEMQAVHVHRWAMAGAAADQDQQQTATQEQAPEGEPPKKEFLVDGEPVFDDNGKRLTRSQAPPKPRPHGPTSTALQPQAPALIA